MKTTKQQLLEVLKYIVKHPKKLNDIEFLCHYIESVGFRKGFDVFDILKLFIKYKPTKRKFKKYYEDEYFYGGNSWWNVSLAKTDGTYKKLMATKISYAKDLIKVLKREIKKESLT